MGYEVGDFSACTELVPGKNSMVDYFAIQLGYSEFCNLQTHLKHLETKDLT